MDQDSFFEEEEAKAYFYYFEQLFYGANDVAIVAPQHSAQLSLTGDKGRFSETVRVITSGSLVNTKICKELGGFDEKLFIDDVDFEYAYRCVTKGYKIIEFNEIRLSHQLGIVKNAGYLSFIKRSGRILHSPFRIYFMVRNHFYVANKYAHLLPEEFERKRRQLLVTLKNNLLFSGKFFQVLRAAIKGYIHYKQNKFSA
jgi:rhamnosyltransferase